VRYFPTDGLDHISVIGSPAAALRRPVRQVGLDLSLYVIRDPSTNRHALATGGQAGTSPRMENYLGFPAGISGGELAERAAIQAAKFGAHLTMPGTARAFRRRDGYYQVTLDDGARSAAVPW
jgi:thioredoxin reductase